MFSKGRIILFNLSDSLLGEHNSQLLGQLVVSKFQQAVMVRAKQSKRSRKHFASASMSFKPSPARRRRDTKS
jgi:hypothetical protein